MESDARIEGGVVDLLYAAFFSYHLIRLSDALQ